ncbi:fatty acid elongase [Halteromyces radiatus]|uniref:fatty acid elongase n=1 Tax=Halteromyces radiatus TaxID=101107 RepID=UPI00221FF756|nr:fatty acid elongase [Halteromyces radiatus]KAI8099789.1 fatty acid elongase [Halteromyces radiatus]
MSISFSAEQPFGIKLYPLFEKAYETIVGQPASAFAFAPGVTPFASTNEVMISCVVYFVAIFGGQFLMKHLPAFKPQILKVPFQIHNFLLTIVSGTLLLLLAEQIWPKYQQHGLFYAVCEPSSWDQKVELIYYMNYLVKFWELLDTVFLVLKKKKLEFLHYFHHSMTMVLCFTQLVAKTTVSWVPILLNLCVHVLMYYYYFRTASGARIWWKKYLTTMQIVQFMIDLVAVYFCSYTYFTYTYYPWMPNMGSCAGTELSASFGCALLSSYLLLFINFYRITYKKKAALKQQQHQSKKSFKQQ